MTENRLRERWTLQQIGAVVSIFIICAWSIAVFLIHAYSPLSGDTLELAFIGTVAVVSLLSIPFYLKRVKWSYLGGILVTILLVVGAIIVALNRAIFFSPSVYNIFVIVVYIAAFACLYFSILSFRQRESRSRRKTVIGICGTILVFALVAILLFTNQSFIRQFTVKYTIQRTYDQLEIIEELEVNDFIQKEESYMGKKKITYYTVTEKGIDFCRKILEPYEVIFPRNGTKLKK